MTNPNQQPIYIMPEDTKQVSGKSAQMNNIAAAKAVAQAVRTTLGPKGMDKMIVDAMGDVVVTNDGVTILKEMQIEHPAAKMVVEIAKTQEDTVGDGTTTAVILAGELMKKAEDLLEQNVHPTILARGYRLAEKEAQKVLLSLAENLSLEDQELLLNIAITAMTGKGAETNKEELAQLVVQAVKSVAVSDDEISNGINKRNSEVISKDIREDTSKEMNINLDNIKVEIQVGESAEKSKLIRGLVLDKERAHSEMPKKVQSAKVALLDSSLEIRNTEIDAKIQITDPNQLNAFLQQEENSLREMVDKVKESGATVLFCQKGIDDLAQHFLAKSGILALRRVKKSDMEMLALATGAKVVSNWKDLSMDDLGFAGFIEEKKVTGENMIFVEGCENRKVVTLLIRGGTEHVVEEIKRAVEDALGDLETALKDGKVVAGAGAVEIELAQKLRVYARTLSGREQLAVQVFAESIETIPRTLAENAGLDPIDILAKLRAGHEHIEGSNNESKKWLGVNVFTGDIMDAWRVGVIEPLKIKTQALSSAVEVAEMILRIDDVILGSSGEKDSQMQRM